MNVDVLIIISCVCMIFIIGKLFIVPIKWILKLVVNSILGGVLIWIINLIGGVWGFHVGLNLYTAILVRNFGSARGYCSYFDENTFNIKRYKNKKQG